MKYVNDKFPDKCYYISNGWAGYYRTVKEVVKDCPSKSLDISERDFKSFVKKLEENGWYANS